ncbi:transcription factor bHLH118-like [Tripterygium wilfordii]|uniref:transcription factor bHLH118-like n=1 Tax=Tripterygium wilfordii TaxID=458696 RepID=UPI0018F7E676|nr:transcription factor bHLH118-like [Tripterygium wilfordii]
MEIISATPYLPISEESIDLDELFQISCNPHHHPQQLLTVPQKDGEVPDCGRRRRKSPAAFGVKDDDHDHMKPDQNKRQKLITHRDIERQRRQEMATLYNSLKSLLPHEILKGKRSTSDQIQEAMNYIKKLETKIQELGDKRDGLIKRSSSSSSSNCSLLDEYCSSDQLFMVLVEPCLVGIRVIINTELGVPLSRFLHLLVGEELSVISYTSSKVNQRMLHSVDCQVSDGRSIDVSELQQKLTNSSVIPTTT